MTLKLGKWRMNLVPFGSFRQPRWTHAFMLGEVKTQTGYKCFRLPFIVLWKPAEGR